MSSDIPARERILQAAGQLFTERGFADVTMLEIATHARVSKRELYALVGNKDELLAECISARGSRMRLPEGYPDPANPQSLHAALVAYGSTFLRELTDPGVVAMFRLGIAEARRSPAVAQSIQDKGRAPARAALGELLRAAHASRLLADADVPRMTSRFNALLWGDLLVWLLLGLEKAPGTKEIERRAKEAADLFLSIHGR